jgi:hypothetical protein
MDRGVFYASTEENNLFVTDDDNAVGGKINTFKHFVNSILNYFVNCYFKTLIVGQYVWKIPISVHESSL